MLVVPIAMCVGIGAVVRTGVQAIMLWVVDTITARTELPITTICTVARRTVRG